MIEKSLLPMRLLKSQPEELFSENRPERVNPLGERDSCCRHCDEEMHVIWHDYVATDGDVVFFRPETEGTIGFVNFLPSKQLHPLVGVEC
jgi:hypothetical protein